MVLATWHPAIEACGQCDAVVERTVQVRADHGEEADVCIGCTAEALGMLVGDEGDAIVAWARLPEHVRRHFVRIAGREGRT